MVCWATLNSFASLSLEEWICRQNIERITHDLVEEKSSQRRIRLGKLLIDERCKLKALLH